LKPTIVQQIAAVEELALRAAAYAATPGVQAVELIRVTAEAERDALLAAIETLKSVGLVHRRAGELLAEIDRRVEDKDPPQRYVTPWSHATALREAICAEELDA